jgi:predicted DNA-binding transcriptional regulator YafY
MDDGILYDLCRRAALEQKILRIKYTDAKGVSTDRRVEPYEIKAAPDNTLFAWSVDPGSSGKMGIRKFKVWHIQSAEVTDEIFQPRFPNMII